MEQAPPQNEKGANHGVDGTASEQGEEDSSGNPQSCMMSTDRGRGLFFLRAYMNTNGGSGEFSETLCLVSKSAHSFTHEIHKKRRARRGGRDTGNSSRCVAVEVTLNLLWCRAEQP